MGSLHASAVPMVDTEASFMERLEAAAAALRVRLGGVKLRDLARCDAAAEVEVALAEAAETAAAGASVVVEAAVGDRRWCKREKRKERSHRLADGGGVRLR